MTLSEDDRDSRVISKGPSCLSQGSGCHTLPGEPEADALVILPFKDSYLFPEAPKWLLSPTSEYRMQKQRKTSHSSGSR